jgi:hypothetical protein
MEANERILVIVKEKGPILPAQIAREGNDSILMTSARLSELLSAKQIKISSLKVGGSPLYYSAGQENKLQNFVDNLNGMEKKAYNTLLQNKILRDSSQEPAIRVALRELKDFAVPLQVNYGDNTEIFWKWYLMDNKEAESSIKNILSKKEVIQKKVFEKPKEEAKKESIELKKDTTKKEKKTIDKALFFKQINNFFNSTKINITETHEIKKNTEIDFIIELQTQIGNVRYFCKAKNKKKINESDLSTALVQAQSKTLPLLFLTTGNISKKAKEKLNTDFKNIVYREI